MILPDDRDGSDKLQVASLQGYVHVCFLHICCRVCIFSCIHFENQYDLTCWLSDKLPGIISYDSNISLHSKAMLIGLSSASKYPCWTLDTRTCMYTCIQTLILSQKYVRFSKSYRVRHMNTYPCWTLLAKSE